MTTVEHANVRGATTPHALNEKEVMLIGAVLSRHPEVHKALLFGSRAKATAHEGSDIDLCLDGDVSPLLSSRITSELEDLPLPYRFDVVSYRHIEHAPLKDHIRRVGIVLYEAARSPL